MPRSRPRIARALVAASAGVVLAYLASRRAGSGDGAPSIQEIRDAVEPGSAGEDDEAGGGIGAGGGSASGVRQRDFEGASSNEGDAADAATGVDIGTDRSADEIEQRAESDVRTEPAEPGEMTVDDEVVEDLVGEDDGN